MRIATWNINGLRARLEFVCHWLEARQPDIVGLQELKLEEEKFPTELFAGLGYEVVVRAQKSWNGVALLSRRPLEVVERDLEGQEELGARLVTARSRDPLPGDLEITTVYCPNGKSIGHEDFPRKLAWFDALVRQVAENRSPDAPYLICGDFNICPEAIDSWNEEALYGHIFHTDEERSRLRSLLDWGLIDLYRSHEPEGRMFSWWDYRGGAFHRNLGLRIDLILATAAVRDRVHRVWVDREYRKKKDGLTASDHAPVLVDLDSDPDSDPKNR